jgi:hypothetical protein
VAADNAVAPVVLVAAVVVIAIAAVVVVAANAAGKIVIIKFGAQAPNLI